jgi:uncharacterized SAM-binding protein YcdF (DUF218 family)
MKALALVGLGLLGLFLAFLWTLILLGIFMATAALLAAVLNWLGGFSASGRRTRSAPAGALPRAARGIANPR